MRLFREGSPGGHFWGDSVEWFQCLISSRAKLLGASMSFSDLGSVCHAVTSIFRALGEHVCSMNLPEIGRLCGYCCMRRKKPRFSRKELLGNL